MTIVQVRSGSLHGSFERGLHVFKGIPYAEPLGGSARWMPPKPRKPWKGTRDARNYGLSCQQFGKDRALLPFPKARYEYLKAIGNSSLQTTIEGDDCLLLNVWTPSVEPGAKLPVMVFIHGGGFVGGAANEVYDASRFAHKNVVAVVIQYRLGPAGFLHGSSMFDGEFCCDNRAFLDQICALQWMQDNISNFGGDPACVTLFGESAGAFAIYQLAASPMAKGLFHRGITMGGMPGTCAPAKEYHALTADVLKAAGIAPRDRKGLAILDEGARGRLQKNFSSLVFGKVKSTDYPTIHSNKGAAMGAAIGTPFLPQAPLHVYAEGTPNNIDLMLGTCKHDGRLFSLTLPLPKTASAYLFLRFLRGLLPGGDIEAMARNYRRHPQKDASVYERINNDAFYRMPTMRAAEAHAQGHPGKTFHYQLDYSSAIPGLGAIHAIDVALLFRTPPVNPLLFEDVETDALTDRMLDAWTSFAATGVPSSASMPRWKPYDVETRETMVFDRNTRAVQDLDGHLRQYWPSNPADRSKA